MAGNPLKDAIDKSGVQTTDTPPAPKAPEADLTAQAEPATPPVTDDVKPTAAQVLAPIVAMPAMRSFGSIDPDTDVVELKFDPNDRYIGPFHVEMDPAWRPRWVNPKHVGSAARLGYVPVPASSVVQHFGPLGKHDVRISSTAWVKQGDNVVDLEGYLLMAIPARGKDAIDTVKRSKLLAPHHEIAESLTVENPNVDRATRAYMQRNSGFEADDGGIYRDDIPR